MVKLNPGKQNGGALVTILVLALLAYGVFVAIQYVPLRIESGSVDSILESLETGQTTAPARSVRDVEDKITSLLSVNQRNDLKENFKVRQNGNKFIITVKFDRELNLLYEEKVVTYENSLTLERPSM